MERHIDTQRTPAKVDELPAEDDGILSQRDAERQRVKIEAELHAQAVTLDRSVLHDLHEIPGAAPISAPELERTRGESLTLEDWLGLRGLTLVDAAGEEIGEIAEVYCDEATQQPEWIGVDIHGAVGKRRVVAPVRGAYIFGEAVSVPYSEELVNGSGAGDGLITGGHERALYERYGLPYSKELSSTGLPVGSAHTAIGIGSFLSDIDATSARVVPEPATDTDVEAGAPSDLVSHTPGVSRRASGRTMLLGIAAVTALLAVAMLRRHAKRRASSGFPRNALARIRRIPRLRWHRVTRLPNLP